jgi:hypothetical protein
MMDYVFRKNNIAWLKMWILFFLFFMISIYVKTHEGGRNGDQMMKEELCETLQISIDQIAISRLIKKHEGMHLVSFDAYM